MSMSQQRQDERAGSLAERGCPMNYNALRALPRQSRNASPRRLVYVERLGDAWIVRERERPCDGDLPDGRIVAAFPTEQEAELVAKHLACSA
jgi:hypothetical protein